MHQTTPQDPDYATGDLGPLGATLRRVYERPAVHRMVPAAVATRLAANRARAREVLNRDEVRDAERFLGALLAHTDRAQEVSVLAPQWMAEKSRQSELFWRPWLATNPYVEGLEHLTDAHQQGRGVIMVFGHIGPIHAVLPAIKKTAGTPHIVAGPHHYDGSHLQGYSRNKSAQWRRYIDLLGPESIILPPNSFARIADVLRAGGIAALATDVPGTTRTPFLGRTVSLAGGASRLGFETGALAVPFVMSRVGTRPKISFEAAVDPRDHRDAADLQARLARVLETQVLADPVAVTLSWNPSPLVVDA